MSEQPYMARGSLPGFGTLLWLQDRAEQANRLEAEVEALRGELEAKEKIAEFARLVIMTGFDGDICGAQIQDWGVEYGLLVEEPYDPDRHGEPASGIFDPGDPIYVHTPLLARKEDTNA
ncbi:hypothetical protein ACFSR7_35940 [Cohnella sp. GCM10020058]|uniref:hypothetical protein n=1 Tax=Cohnella sp. GCM10020058 TaxID=3317330 RepID=UPI00363F41A3